MRYTQLRAFHFVATYGGFTRAAEVLNQTQPSVSDHVRRLEQAHDTLLFHRDRRQIRLTEAGEGLFRMTRQFFELEDRMAAYLDQSRAALAGTLRIVADSAVHITEAVGAFRAAHPEVFVSLRAGNTQDVLQRLRSYEAEIGVIGNIPQASDLDIVDLGQTPIVAITRKDRSGVGRKVLTFRDLAKLPLVLREKGSRTRASIEEAAARHGVALEAAIEVEGREAMREVVASGAGVGFVSEAELGHDRRLARVPLEDDGLAMSEALVTLSARRDVPIIRAFLRTVAAAMPAGAKP